jgi:hypothetical protein
MMTASIDPAQTPSGAHPRFPRWMILAMYAAYPAGIALLEAAESVPAQAVGLVFVTASFLLAARLWRSPWWRPGNAPDRMLDERELALRNRAYQRAYTLVCSVTLLTLIYLQLAFDADDRVRFWLPASYGEASRLFWGAFLLLVTLPAALLAWDRERFD